MYHMLPGDYALLCWNENGKASNGAFMSSANVEINVYKNWLYLYDDGYRIGNSPTACIMEAMMGYKDIVIDAARSPYRDTLCFVVRDTTNAKVKGIAGIASIAYIDDKWVGIDEYQKQIFQQFIARETFPYTIPACFKTIPEGVV